MSKLIDLTGKVYGRLTVISFSHRKDFSYGRKYFWICKCECGKTTRVEISNLRAGTSKSCGCYNRECISKMATTHGDRKSKEYNTWCGIKARCYNPNNSRFKDYGRLGVCARWLESYENFLEDMGRAPSKNHSIERIDNNKGYSPQNCKWATRIEQANNKRTNVRVDLNGDKVSLAQWCGYYKLPYGQVHALHRYKNLSFKQILEKFTAKEKARGEEDKK